MLLLISYNAATRFIGLIKRFDSIDNKEIASILGGVLSLSVWISALIYDIL